MKYQKYYLWMDPPEFRRFSEDLEKQGTPPVEENRIPCRVLRPSLDRYVVFPSAWDGFCERRTSWYRKSDKAGKILVVSSTSFCHSDFGNPIMITESNFSPPRVPSPDEVAQLIESQEFQKKKPPIWEQVDPLEKEFYQRWLQRHRAEEPFDFEKIFAHHSANHANFLNPEFFVNLNGIVVPYSIADTIHVCSSCLEFFNIIGSQFSVKYVVPCIGAVQFAHLPANQYFEVTTQP